MADAKSLEKMQMQQQQMQAVMMQKEALKAQLTETENALKELEKTKETVYKITGPLLLKVDKKDMTDELEERKKFISLKINTLEKSEKRLAEELSEARKSLSSADKKPIKVGG